MSQFIRMYRASRVGHMIAGASPAFTFVLVMGIVNLFADMTYEGGASINGPFLGTLGASAATVSIIAGAGEFLGYSLRAIAGYIADRTGKYWVVTFIGYAINLLAVPAMAWAGSWQIAGALILAERTGRAIRKPTVEAMLSYSAGQHRRGWVYAMNTALDETGATIGPLLMALMLFRHSSYRTAYTTLLMSSLLALTSLTVARLVFPVPSQLENKRDRSAEAKGFSAGYWLYMVAAACFGAGLMSFEFVSYHLSSHRIVDDHWIPLFLAISTGVGVLASLILGRLYDRIGLPTVLIAVGCAACFSPLVFFGGWLVALGGLILWGIGYAVQDTLLKAVVAGMLPEGKRSLAFGLFYTGYGVAWLVGSTVAGLLYSRSLLAVVAFSVVLQLASLPLFVVAERAQRRSGGQRGK
jgi:predicted MFS family arabinose efflux permease